MDGGVYLSDGDAPPSPPVYLPWGATEREAELALGSLRAGSGGVQVHRSGDGLATAVFTITFLKAGDVPLLSVDGAPLRRAVPIADSVNDTYTDATSVAIEELAPGGVDLTPLPPAAT